MMKKVTIVEPNELSKYNSINEYLINTYGKKKLEQSRENSNPTFLDVIGYTLNHRGFETIEPKAYELEEIEEMMKPIEDEELEVVD